MVLLRARQNLAYELLQGKTADEWRRSAELYESIVRLRTGAESDGRVIFPLAMAHAKLERADLAEPRLREALELRIPPRAWVEAAFTLGGLLRRQGREREAGELFARARQVPGIDPAFLRELEERVHPK